MQNSRLQEHICDYVDGTMDNQVRASFEQFIQENQIVRSFVDAASQGKRNLKLLSGMKSDPLRPVDSETVPVTGIYNTIAQKGFTRRVLGKLMVLPPLIVILAFIEFLRRNQKQ